MDRAERKRHEEQEREMLLRAAKSRSKSEDPEQAKLKAKAKEMQRVEMEELRQREANATALQAIGPRKKPRLDGDGNAGSTQVIFAISLKDIWKAFFFCCCYVKIKCVKKVFGFCLIVKNCSSYRRMLVV